MHPFSRVLFFTFFILHISDRNILREKKGAVFVNNEVYQEVYGHILNDAQRIRKEIMNEWGDTLMFGGTMPSDVLDDLSNVARITGLSFDALKGHGVSYSPVNGKPDLFCLNVRGEKYVCHKSAIPSMSGFLDVVNVPGVNQEPKPTCSSQPQVNAHKEPEEEVRVEQEKPVSNFSSYQGRESFDSEEVDAEGESFESQSEQLDDFYEDSPEESEYEEESDVDNAEDSEESVALEEPEAEEYEDESDEEEPLVFPKNTAEIIGGNTKISTFGKRDIFMEESKKNINDIIYEMIDINLSHSGFSGGGRAEKMTIMIAPLKIQKFAAQIVPIIVSVYHNGKIITKSSYDLAEDGKNLVTMDVNEFYMLFRGTFDANGRFKGIVTTTGISASQGDILTVSSDVVYGNTDNKSVNNGHIKVRSIVDESEGVIEAFPFGDPEDDEFIVLTKNDEFVDYLYVSDGAKGIKKPIIYSEGKKKQIYCSWDKDHEVMSLDLKEV